jgi:hypothetical protein
VIEVLRQSAQSERRTSPTTEATALSARLNSMDLTNTDFIPTQRRSMIENEGESNGESEFTAEGLSGGFLRGRIELYQLPALLLRPLPLASGMWSVCKTRLR